MTTGNTTDADVQASRGRDGDSRTAGRTGGPFVLSLTEIILYACLVRAAVPRSLRDGRSIQRAKHASLGCTASTRASLGTTGRLLTRQKRPTMTMKMPPREDTATERGTMDRRLMESTARKMERWIFRRINLFALWARLMSMQRTALTLMFFFVRLYFLVRL